MLFRTSYYSKSIPLQQYESIYQVLQNINLFAIQHKRQKNNFILFALVKNNSIVFGLEPFHGILFDQTMRLTNFCCSFSSVGYIHPCTAKHNVKVHAIDTNRWIVLYSQIDMFLDAESKVSVS